ncbi:choice-of-anchor D domain-containing protein, partial [Micromonospora sp. 4G55]
MPNIRGVLSGVIAAVVVTTAVSGPAIAAPAATPPHTALTVDGHPNSWWYQGSQVFDQAAGATFTVGAAAGGELNLRADQGGDNWTWRLAPPTGASWTAGTTYQLAGYPSAEYALVDVQHAGAGCDEAPGTLTVREATTDPETGALTAFAASYGISCFSSYDDLHGEIRWQSSVDYAAAATDVMSHNFGDRLVGSAPVTRTITVTSTGSAATVFGTASFLFPTTAHSITGDTCSDTTRAPGETCTITISAAPTKLGGDWTWLQLPDNTSLGKRYVQLGVNGLDPRTVGVSPASLSFGDQYIADRGQANSVTVTGTSAEPTTFGAATVTGTDASSFVVTADTCKGATLAKGQTCRVDVAPVPAGAGIRTAVLELPNNSLSSPRTVPLTANGVIGSRGTYYPLSPARIMDTRTGNGAAKAKLGPNGTANLQVTGRGGVPSTGVSAVVLNVTVTEPTASSFLTVYPSGKPKPNASSLNFKRGWTRSNSVTVAVGSGGKVAINNSSGYTHAIVDVVGFYASDNSFMFTERGLGGQFLPVVPRRLFDSRSDWGQKLPADHQVRLALNYGYDANWRMRAAVVNITAVTPTSAGFLTAWNGEWPEPKTSTVNYGARSITPNLAV